MRKLILFVTFFLIIYTRSFYTAYAASKFNFSNIKGSIENTRDTLLSEASFLDSILEYINSVEEKIIVLYNFESLGSQLKRIFLREFDFITKNLNVYLENLLNQIKIKKQEQINSTI